MLLSWDPNSAWDDGQSQQNAQPASNNYGSGYAQQQTDSWNPDASWNQGQQNYAYTAGAGDQTDTVIETDPSQPQKQVGNPPAPEFYKSKDPKASQMLVDPLLRPAEGGAIALITWRVCYPIHYLCQKTVPDCRTEKYRNWYGATFVISMLWISFYSYLMVCSFFGRFLSIRCGFDVMITFFFHLFKGLDDHNNWHDSWHSRYSKYHFNPFNMFPSNAELI